MGYDDYLFTTVATVDVRSHRMILWDLGGQEDLQQLWDKVGTLRLVPLVPPIIDTEQVNSCWRLKYF